MTRVHVDLFQRIEVVLYSKYCFWFVYLMCREPSISWLPRVCCHEFLEFSATWREIDWCNFSIRIMFGFAGYKNFRASDKHGCGIGMGLWECGCCGLCLNVRYFRLLLLPGGGANTLKGVGHFGIFVKNHFVTWKTPPTVTIGIVLWIKNF